MLAVHFGAGNIGRGFIGKLLYQSGFETCFVDVNKEIVNLLNERGEYSVVLADSSQEAFTVKNVRALNSQEQPDAVVDAIANADLVTTAVGPNILPFIAGLIAKGLRQRSQTTDRPLNIIACENMIGGSTLLKEKVYEHVSGDEKAAFDKQFGFPDAAVDRIVPNQQNEDKLMVMVEPFYEWVVEETKLAGEKPPVQGITFVTDLIPYIERKLFTVNTGHAVAAYFGYLFGIPTINEAMANSQVYELVKQALEESGEFLVAKYGFDAETHAAYIQKILQRFANPYISDEVTRVARSPIRKLGPNDRLVSPAKQYAEVVGKQPVYLVKAIAAALLYDYQGDDEATAVQTTIQQNGIAAAIEQYTQLDQNDSLFQAILDQYQQFQAEK
ncbi:mannitol-1-phosphate 5-dehydrogenase [Ectobacillus ponti]|uniref:Mannitol-1-phosphate 5-dehydrogenase n=1 Tax=Ectobacillus ponti TaxID=2961894 RepID=A0AA41XAB0_9BACI|nr:mannitol-1-phosphate 5-dehydrogenase [Ectobacillus ponti]MCP8969634.1 mannitol-1-phosphate 5-dehydrogenase [Ectobacillus ponti]